MQIQITERNFINNTWQIEVLIENERYNVELPNPVDGKQEKELEWYFESYMSEAYAVALSRVENAKGIVKEYGVLLFDKVFKSNTGLHFAYRALVQKYRIKELIFSICGETPEFHSLHWEMLFDNQLSKPFAIEGAVFIRQNLRPRYVKAEVEPSPFINLLMVTSRPDWEEDINHRTIQRPLINLIEHSKLKVKPHILRPGTYESLVRHLDDKKNFYHIVHFDMHGILTSFDTLQRIKDINGLLFSGRFGRDDLKPFKGERAFIIFETDKKGISDPVEASEIAGLLQTTQIPVCILNSCQSAKQDSDSSTQIYGTDEAHTSLGYHIIQSGMQTVLAMRYSLSVTAAKVMMKRLYESLFQNDSNIKLDRVFADARTELSRTKERCAALDQKIQLEDWVLPIVYKNREVDFQLRPMTPAEETTFYEERETQFAFTEPIYGFHGRDTEILQIEKKLLRLNQLHIQGMGGAGKTTLLKYLGAWWQKTGFVKKVFYFGYDKEAYNLTHILKTLSYEVLKKEQLEIYDSRSLAVQKGWISDALNAEKYLLILDNMESITGEKLSIPNLLNEEKRRELKHFLQTITKKTFILYGSRSNEEWLAEGTFIRRGINNHITLGGFDRQVAYNFAKKILDSLDLPESATPENVLVGMDFKRLMRLLDGYPLAMQVVLPLLKNKSATDIVTELQSGADLQAREIKDKTQSILKCIEYSHSNLSPASQHLLLLLAPFQMHVWMPSINLYFEKLKEIETFKHYPFDKINEVISDAIRNGFMQPEYEEIGIYKFQPVFTWFLKNILNRDYTSKFTFELNSTFVEYFRDGCYDIVNYITSENVNEKNFGLLLANYLLANLHFSLDFCIEQHEKFWDDFYSAINEFLKLQNRHDERLKLAEYVLKRMESMPSQILTGKLAYEYGAIFNELGYCYISLNQFTLAQKYLLKALDFYEKLDSAEDSQLVHPYHNLGVSCQGLEQYEEATKWYQKALEIFKKANKKKKEADILLNMGNLQYYQNKFTESKNYFFESLKLYEELGQELSKGSVYQSLGMACVYLKEAEESTLYFQNALKIYHDFKFTRGEAGVYQNWGVLMDLTGNFEESIRLYQKALNIFIHLGAKYKEAGIYINLGVAYINLKKFTEAKDFIEKGQKFFKLHKDEYILKKASEAMKLLKEASGNQDNL